jgi:voltage-gated potassium channel Kch
MITKLLIAFGLMAVCVVVHATGVTVAVRRLRRLNLPSEKFWPWTLVFIRLAVWVVFLHLVEITVWALFYLWQRAMPDLQSSLYFIAVTYTTTGYGDLVLPDEWRLLGAVEALTGILMCAWSTGFFLTVVSRMFRTDGTDARSTI